MEYRATSAELTTEKKNKATRRTTRAARRESGRKLPKETPESGTHPLNKFNGIKTSAFSPPYPLLQLLPIGGVLAQPTESRAEEHRRLWIRLHTLTRAVSRSSSFSPGTKTPVSGETETHAPLSTAADVATAALSRPKPDDANARALPLLLPSPLSLPAPPPATTPSTSPAAPRSPILSAPFQPAVASKSGEVSSAPPFPPTRASHGSAPNWGVLGPVPVRASFFWSAGLEVIRGGCREEYTPKQAGTLGTLGGLGDK